MPPRIEPEHRRRQVIEAAFRIVVAAGLEGLSLRKVAEEAGLNIGSVRHYFDGHLDLLAAAAQEAGDRMARRLAKHPVEQLGELRGTDALDAVQALIEEVLPLDEQRRDETIVVVELVMASRTRPVFHEMAERMGTDLADVLQMALQALGVRAPGTESARLAALISGMTVEAVTPHSEFGPDVIRATLRAQLEALVPGPTASAGSTGSLEDTP
ncbi:MULTISPECIES: TetR/AcrR family transcriptional regulator [Prauserella salsuginis group]|uniref:TetR/AcrR family transcriptional regulator n=1 Tax=Prauserella salsuginis TaxID=387889 RepID=A0ABW6FWX9_9PSEU|nr:MULTISPECIES: TetR family transcriptional regulator C-terminal domain-containing protein [Prauserella salsuginis group]MCR3720283.1 transcriptional regulator, TetR family [Prauserella flava]MCR3734009.1 transcriptional regulator, TetR family [Prauserella salsuginis]